MLLLRLIKTQEQLEVHFDNTPLFLEIFEKPLSLMAEKEFGKMFGRGASNLIKDRIKDGKLPSYMKLLAGSRIAGAVVMCGLVSYLWATQKDNTHRRIRNASSRIGVL